MSTNKPLADLQSSRDPRNLAIQKVGIKDFRHPVIILDKDFFDQDYQCPTVANFNMYVDLEPHVKGTHMSLFIELLNEYSPLKLSLNTLPGLLDGMLGHLSARSAYIEADFSFLLEKKAPISGVKSYLDYDLSFRGKIVDGTLQTGFKLVVPVTTLCPCSKEISKYGAHNQRSHVTLEAWVKDPLFLITPLIKIIENQASCDVYGAVKRLDEKYLTEKAYENPKFVEDLVRDIAIELNNSLKFSYYRIASENFESIHNHSAYAEIVFPQFV